MKKEFCKECGFGLVEKQTKVTYSQETGKPIQDTVKLCVNTKCEEGCSFTGGHVYKIFNKYCIKCGYNKNILVTP